MSEKDSDACTLGQLSNEFLTVKQNRLSSGELSGQSFRSYYETCEALIRHFGKHRRVDDLKPIDFEGYRKVIADRFAATGLLNEVNRCRAIYQDILEFSARVLATQSFLTSDFEDCSAP